MKLAFFTFLLLILFTLTPLTGLEDALFFPLLLLLIVAFIFNIGMVLGTFIYIVLHYKSLQQGVTSLFLMGLNIPVAYFSIFLLS